MTWDTLIARIDYHHKKWYVREDNEWVETGVPFRLFDDIAPEIAPDMLVRLFRYRDRETTARQA